ncbi:MAG: DUF485 domain-containing protein [Akkermansiaceae bacterium]
MNPIHEPNWSAIAAMPEFQALLRAKRRFVIPCCVFFSLYYLTFLILVGWHAQLLSKPLVGKVNGAYLFALSQFFMTWIMAYIYMYKANQFDKAAADLLKKAGL